MNNFISPEKDDGNEEYKLRLTNHLKIEQITTQMRYRMEEGNGEAFYTLGVKDDGEIIGLTDDEYKKSKEILDIVSEKNGYVITEISKNKISQERTMYEFLVREKNNKYIDIRVACAGNVDAGKCEAKGTKIVMHSGETKEIQNIIVGDILLGDDRTQRTVSYINFGYAHMYRIILDIGDPIIITKNHILCFKVKNPNRIFYNESLQGYKVNCLVWKNKNPVMLTRFFSSKDKYGFSNKINAKNDAAHYLNELLTSDCCIIEGEVIEMSLERFVNLDVYTQRLLKLYNINGKEIEIVSISIEKEQEYYGFELDGNGRYVHSDGLITHNSSLLGVLLSGQNDNGRGSARLNVFNFSHEVKTGRTSSIAQHILGFNAKGDPIHHVDSLGYRRTWPEIVKASSKIITFFDLCGHEKYLKTTISGMTSQFPDLVLILVGGNMGISKMTKEHIFLCLSLNIPFTIIITKLDICRERIEILNETVKDIKKLLSSPGIRKVVYDIKNIDDISICIKNAVVPIFYVSNVSGEGIEHLYRYLNLYNKQSKLENSPNSVELHIQQTFQVLGVGLVIGGQLIKGKIKVGDKLLIGPNNNSYSVIQVRSIHCKRIAVNEVESGCYVCLGIKKPDNLIIRRGNAVLGLVDKSIQVREFEADVAVLKSHSTTIKVGYSPVIHSCSVRQTGTIISIKNKQGRNGDNSDEILRTGDRGTVRFRFFYRSEFLRKGFRILLAEGGVKLIGKITDVLEMPVEII